MKKSFIAIGIICVFFILACATTGETADSGVAHRARDFTVDRSNWISITGLAREGFTSVHIPETLRGLRVSFIQWGAFNGAGLLEAIFNGELTTVGSGAFANNNLTKIDINVSLDIDSRAFANNNLNEVNIRGNVNRIRSEAFMDNEIINLTLPSGNRFVEIGVRAFANNNLTSVTIPSTVTILGIDAFAGNPLMETFVLPETVTTITGELHPGTPGFFDGLITRSETNTFIRVRIENVRFWPMERDIITIPSEMYGIPVTVISRDFFSGETGSGITGWTNRERNRRKLNTLVLPENLREIQIGAFAYCDVENVIAPNDTVQEIWDAYYSAQHEQDLIGYQRAFNMTVEQMRGAFRSR